MKPKVAATGTGSGEGTTIALFSAGLCAAVVLLIVLQSRLTFRIDDWVFLLNRSNLDPNAILAPHNGHLMALPALIYKGLLETFGMSSAVPFSVVSTALFAVAMAVVFEWMRARVGGWLALAGLLPVLVLGSASDDLLWSFQLGFFGSMACGVGALLALDRRDRATGGRWACTLLVLGLAFSSLGICFILAVVARLSFEPGRRRNAYVVGVPIGLYALWWLGWDRGAASQVTRDNLIHAPLYVVSGFASSLGSLFGLVNETALLGFPQNYSARAGPGLASYALLAVVVLVVAVVFLRRSRPFAPGRLVPILVLAGSYWVLAAATAKPVFGAPIASRYQWMGAIFVLMVAAELARGMRIGRWPVIIALVLGGLGAYANLNLLLDDAGRYETLSQAERAGLGAVEIAGDSGYPGLKLPAHVPLYKKGTGPVTRAGSYMSAVEAWGSPAYSESELAARPEGDRATADETLGAALGLRLKPDDSVTGPCRTVQAPLEPATALELGPGRISLETEGATRASVRLGRFSDALPVKAGALRPGARASLAIPSDRSDRPWRLGLQGRGPVTVCGGGR